MTTLLIQTDRILHNFDLVQRIIGNTAVIPVLKGNAYGLGDVAVARLLCDHGVRLVAVSRIEEAERIVSAVPQLDVLLLSSYSTEDEAVRIVQSGIIATIGSNDSAVLLSGTAARNKRTARVHIRFDVGTGDCGFLPKEAQKAAQTVRFLPNIQVCGAYSHFYDADSEKAAKEQFDTFTDCLQVLRREGVEYGSAHISATDAALRYPWARMDAVRIGSGLTGRLDIKDKWGFKKVGRMVSRIYDIRWLPEKSNVGKSFKTKGPMKVGFVPVGTADGVFSDLSGGLFGQKYTCEVSGKKVAVIGEPGYTSISVDVTALDCAVGERVSFDVSPKNVNAEMRRDYV